MPLAQVLFEAVHQNTIKVYYDPDAPAQAVLINGRREWNYTGLKYIGWIVAIVAAVQLVLSGRKVLIARN